jgi:hypothetical protein
VYGTESTSVQDIFNFGTFYVYTTAQKMLGIFMIVYTTAQSRTLREKINGFLCIHAPRTVAHSARENLGGKGA